ncbi:hypothetical protein IO382_000636 [Campylobacter lari]|uniref:hypothetical protein n=1 Tax=Campylobacter TaxID=194 RepID=UPI0012CFCB12|nr:MULTISPECIES: hypothetical protein [Campylobacter]EGK8058263.1 hypothetical protein [Campylobacter lari]EGK8096613.1 hypothetical protein [Campylobacter lari]EGO0809109.1 hypothetical protein [Campylobacter lari]MBT0827502.1 hypothetical protein [Campylobacter lari]MCV3394014.1 hypothetical protein [Campylobacter sp. IFREMER_LSEM_CL908]
MGFLDTLKSIAISAKCGIGWHGGTYSNEEGKPQCYLSKTCPDCNEYISKYNHNFAERVITDPYSCRGYEECTYCQHREFGTYHKFEKVRKNERCQIIEKCSQCGKERLGDIQHSWVQIPFTNKDASINGKRKCRDCGYIEQ